MDLCIREYKEFLEKLTECESLTEVSACLENVIFYKEKMYQRVQGKIAEIKVESRKKKEELDELNHNIRELEAKRLIYPPMVNMLRSRIQEQFLKLGRKGEVRILCELLEMKDTKWQNAVEGYLNTQRFYLLVEPKDFDLALSVYERMRSQRKAYGVGLVNTGKLDKYDSAPQGSLAEKVISRNIWARRYINMVLGKVHCCGSYQELKQYPVSITRQCMRYQNHVVSAISPEIYETPYIGSEAYKRQLEQRKRQRERLEQILADQNQRLANLENVVDPLSKRHDIDVKYRLKSLENLRQHEVALTDCRKEMRELSASQTMLQKRIRLEALQNQKRQLDKDVEEAAGWIGRCKEKTEQYKQIREELLVQLAERSAYLAELAEQLKEDFSHCEKEYVRQTEDKPLDKFIENFERAKKANWTLKEKAEEEMIRAMRAYKVAHDFGAAESLTGYPEFLAEYEKLKDSQLLEYEEKVYQARKAAEEEFKEQFLSRLQENIKQAQNEFKELNRALKEIRFSKEQYEFLYQQNSGLKKYYQMIMSDFNIMQGESIFSSTFNEIHKEVIDELFEKLALDDEQSSKTLEEYTDYRTYMDYDIKISNEDGSYMLYSKVSREKSGGETQTPFYITIAASFMQLYRNSIGGDSIGLVMMDEAFNNMDDERIRGVLTFMNHSNLQTIIAAPPDKIQYIGPAMRKVLLVLQDENVSYVEDFTRETV